MLRLENIKIHDDLSEEEVVKEACRKYKLDYREVEKYTIFKKSIKKEFKLLGRKFMVVEFRRLAI